MNNIGLLEAIVKVRKYNKLSEQEREIIRENRLNKLIRYARANSPYYNNLYKNLPNNYCLEDLPIINKQIMMKEFDTWVTDRSIKLKNIMSFMNNLDNVGIKFNDKYFVFTTSGSRGFPAVILYDKSTKSIMDAISINRAFAHKEDISKFIKAGGKSAGVYATEGFYLSNGTVEHKLKSMPWKKKQLMITSIFNEPKQILYELNQFQPTMLGGYPTALELLTNEKNLNIHPQIIMTGGEYLADDTRKLLEDNFKCHVQSGYSCTEGGMVACECREKHYHLNDDWIIMEPVDKNNNPVDYGELADKWLLTNLSNNIQPLIRYEITDRIILHKEKCSCGNDSPWLEVEGRSDDILYFKEGNEIISIAPLTLYAILKEIDGIQQFQLLLYPENKLELRISSNKDKDIAFNQAKEGLNKYFNERGISNLEYKLSDIFPQRDKSGKFKHIIKM